MTEARPPRTLGPGHDEFWSWCDKGELRVQRCGACGHLAWPVVQACDRCGSAELAFAPMSGRGTLASWCTFERDYYGGLLPLPWETILVELDEGVLFISNPQGFGHREAQPWMALRVGFVDCEDSAGAFRLPVFAPA